MIINSCVPNNKRKNGWHVIYNIHNNMRPNGRIASVVFWLAKKQIWVGINSPTNELQAWTPEFMVQLGYRYRKPVDLT